VVWVPKEKSAAEFASLARQALAMMVAVAVGAVVVNAEHRLEGMRPWYVFNADSTRRMMLFYTCTCLWAFRYCCARGFFNRDWPLHSGHLPRRFWGPISCWHLTICSGMRICSLRMAFRSQGRHHLLHGFFVSFYPSPQRLIW